MHGPVSQMHAFRLSRVMLFSHVEVKSSILSWTPVIPRIGVPLDAIASEKMKRTGRRILLQYW